MLHIRTEPLGLGDDLNGREPEPESADAAPDKRQGPALGRHLAPRSRPRRHQLPQRPDLGRPPCPQAATKQPVDRGAALVFAVGLALQPWTLAMLGSTISKPSKKLVASDRERMATFGDVLLYVPCAARISSSLASSIAACDMTR